MRVHYKHLAQAGRKIPAATEKWQYRQVLGGTGSHSLNSACRRFSCIGHLSVKLKLNIILPYNPRLREMSHHHVKKRFLNPLWWTSTRIGTFPPVCLEQWICSELFETFVLLTLPSRLFCRLLDARFTALWATLTSLDHLPVL